MMTTTTEEGENGGGGGGCEEMRLLLENGEYNGLSFEKGPVVKKKNMKEQNHDDDGKIGIKMRRSWNLVEVIQNL
eukprot:13421705-Ditylum_brightwellii.AAC.1